MRRAELERAAAAPGVVLRRHDPRVRRCAGVLLQVLGEPGNGILARCGAVVGLLLLAADCTRCDAGVGRPLPLVDVMLEAAEKEIP